MIDESGEIAADSRIPTPSPIHAEDPDAALGQIAFLTFLALAIPNELTGIVDDSGVLLDGLEGEHTIAMNFRASTTNTGQLAEGLHAR